MNAIRLTPEAVKVLNEMCEESSLSLHIFRLRNAEDALQKAAYDDDAFDYMFRYAYEMKQLREEFEKLRDILGYEPEDE